MESVGGGMNALRTRVGTCGRPNGGMTGQIKRQNNYVWKTMPRRCRFKRKKGRIYIGLNI